MQQGESQRSRRKRKKRKGPAGPGQGGGGGGNGISGGGGGYFASRGMGSIPSHVLPSDEQLEREAAELEKFAANADPETLKDQISIGDLQSMEMEELYEVAEKEGIEESRVEDEFSMAEMGISDWVLWKNVLVAGTEEGSLRLRRVFGED